MSADRPSFLTETSLQLLLFGGKGGVGKTSCAAATALRLAQHSPQRAILLVSTDPAHSLADSLAGSSLPANLQVIELDAQECLAVFKRQHGAKLNEIASRGTFLDQDDISSFMDLSLPGLDELMASLEISRWVETRRYQTIVLDTAPTGHTLRLLAMPALIRQWLQALDALLAKHRYMRGLYHAGAKPDELDHFLKELGRSVNQMETLLRDASRSRFVPVMLAEEMSFSETRSLLDELKRAQVPVTDLVINRLYPENECVTCAEGRALQLRVLREISESRVFGHHALWGVPLYPDEVRGTEALAAFWEGITSLLPAALLAPAAQAGAEVPAPPETSLMPTRPWVEAAVAPPSNQQTLLLFAGKGGVGKTTLACATSLRLAQDSPDSEVLLFSTDPAHSLSDCLGVPVGPQLKTICPGLTALEIDAAAEFASFKRQYSEELHLFLKSLLGNMDLAFDREAMERVIDLSPPGLDEVMALTQVMDLLEQGRYRTLVLDAAPTGHLIRLLEMPELIDRWLKVFFGLFLKYQRIFRLPKIAERLVATSKSLKRLRALLTDPTQCALYGVTILTEMAFEETKDLLAAGERMQINVPALFLNLATPPSGCPLCSALERREATIRQRFQGAFPNAAQVLVYRRGEPRGLTPLGGLAQALYVTSTHQSTNHV